MSADAIRKKREQFALGKRIDKIGFEMSPCSFCEKNGFSCVVATSESGRCSSCARRGRRCDVEGIPVGDWDTLEREESRLDAAETIAEDTLRKAQQEASEALNRLSRLRKQKQFLRNRAADMLRRGLKTMDELEAEEAKERSLSNVPDSSSNDVPLDPATAAAFVDFDPSSPFWAGFDFGGPSSFPVSADDSGGTHSRDPGS
jgi:hypothetical protein